METAAPVSVTLTVPPDVVATTGAFVPTAFSVIAPVPVVSCNVPVVNTDPALCEIVPVPVAVNVTPVAPPPDPMPAASAILPLAPPPVFCINTAPVAFNRPFTVIVGVPTLVSVNV